ncbi:hypothetical protein HMP09_0953 [Sphingomonas sp. HMP9]|uniref:DUF6975 family protein n=1 Tax=Sphingomonas sp. HMP9 TaxID=1517554 RepID=UPI00159826FB|nr:hypothetical protein [Sphingomonas sp. HMP9]BCA61719.1 hypothetical protein HMP09_0953 [Sphingomonas sp. HMP9]
MMVSNAGIHGGEPGERSAWDALVALAEADGSASHPHQARLIAGGPGQRNLSDAVHALCAVHGDHPGLIADVLARAVQPEASDWLAIASSGFADERTYLAHLTAAVGPLPSTPGQAETESALVGERHALEMLARSERRGCATGAVASLLHDWHAIRRVLDAAAERFGVAIPPLTIPSETDTAAIIADLGASPGCQRAILFGAQQLFAQHRCLWSLLEARSSARGDL